jgi:hypothetical protein
LIPEERVFSGDVKYFGRLYSEIRTLCYEAFALKRLHYTQKEVLLFISARTCYNKNPS